MLYKDTAGTSAGVTMAQMKTGPAGKTKVKFSAAGANLVLPGPAGTTYFDQEPNLIVQLVNSVGTCWTSEFEAGDTKKSEADKFKAQTK